MVRRRLTLKRIDPWSVLKFGFVANLSLLAIGLLGAAVVWFFIERLQLISKVCEIALEMGFTACGVNGGNLFRALFLLGLLGVVIQTGLMVFLAFLANLIADLVGGLAFSFVDDTPGAAARGDVPATQGRAAGVASETRGQPATPRQGPPPPLGREDDARSGSTGNAASPRSAPSAATPGGTGTTGTPPSSPRDPDRMWGDTTQVRRTEDRPDGGTPSR